MCGFDPGADFGVPVDRGCDGEMDGVLGEQGCVGGHGCVGGQGVVAWHGCCGGYGSVGGKELVGGVGGNCCDAQLVGGTGCVHIRPII